MSMRSAGKNQSRGLNLITKISHIKCEEAMRACSIEREAVDVYGLRNLGTRLPPTPTPEAVRVIREMFEASIDGEL